MSVPQTTLSAAISTAGATSITVRDALGFADSAETDDVILVGTEYMLVTAGMGGLTWTVTRGYNSSTAATASNGATVTRIVRNYTDLNKVRRLLDGVDITSAAPVAFLLDSVEAANSWLTSEVGRYIGPSYDTSRTFDIGRSGKRLFVPGGIRSVTTLGIAEYTGATSNNATAADLLLRPHAWQLLDGLTYDRIEFKDIVVGSISQFFSGRGTTVVTGSFGPAEPPPALTRIASAVAVWLYKSRGAGQGGIIGDDIVIDRVLTPADRYTITRYRHAVADYGYV